MKTNMDSGNSKIVAVIACLIVKNITNKISLCLEGLNISQMGADMTVWDHNFYQYNFGRCHSGSTCLFL